MAKVLPQPPYVLSNLQDCDAVFPGLNKRRLNEETPSFPAFKILSNILLIPAVHLLHRFQNAFQRRNHEPLSFTNKGPAASQHKMIM